MKCVNTYFWQTNDARDARDATSHSVNIDYAAPNIFVNTTPISGPSRPVHDAPTPAASAVASGVASKIPPRRQVCNLINC